MPESTEVSKVMDRALDQVEDKLFGLLWAATFLQALLILWETAWLIRLSDLGTGLWGPDSGSWAGKVRATEVTSTIYLIFQMAYMGKKEFLRWTKGVAGVISLKAGSELDDKEVARRIRRGDVAIVFWGVLALFCGLLYSASLVSRMPAELTRTLIQVIGIYAFAAASKGYKHEKDKKVLNGPAAPARISAPPQTGLRPAVPVVPRQLSSETEEQLLSLLSQQEEMTTSDIVAALGVSRSRVQQILTPLIAAGKVVKKGSARSVTYGKA